ncbi:MFS transporter [Sphingobium chungangianum]
MSGALQETGGLSRMAGHGREKFAAIAAAFLGLMAGYPSSYGATATTFILPLTQEFGWGRLIPSLMYLASMTGMMVTSFWLGRLIKRFSAARVAGWSGLGLAIAMVMLGLQTGSAALAIGLCFFVGILGAGTGVGLYLSVLPAWFDRDLGRALGFSIVGQSAGIAVMPAFAATVTSAAGWRTAYMALASAQIALTLIAATVLFWLARRAVQLAPSATVAPAAGMRADEAIADRRFWLLIAILFFASTGVFGAAIHMFPLFVDRGVDPAGLPMVALSLGVGTLIGRIGSGFLLDHWEARLVSALCFGTGALGVGWLIVAGAQLPPAAVLLTPALIGAALGAESDILAYLVRRLFGMRDYSVIYNRQLIAYYVGAVTGTLALGIAFDQLADPTIALAGLCLCCIVAAVLSLMLPSTRCGSMEN